MVRMPDDIGLTRTWARAVLPEPDNPTDGITCRDRDEFLARLQRDIADLPGAGIEPVERALRIGIDLDRVDITIDRGLDQGAGATLLDGFSR